MSGLASARDLVRRCLGAAALVVLAAGAAEAQGSIEAKWLMKKTSTFERHVVALEFVDCLVIDDDHPLDPTSIKLFGIKDGSSWPVEFTISPTETALATDEEVTGVPGSTPVYLQVHLLPATLPGPGITFVARIVPGRLLLWDGSSLALYADPADLTIDTAGLVLNQELVHPKTTQPQISIGAGSDQGTLSFKFDHSLDELSGKDWLHFELGVRGDMTLQSGTAGEYFNSLTAEFRGFGVDRTTFWGSTERYQEYGLHYRFESDQRLENADVVFGADYALYTKDPLSAAIASLFVDENSPAVTPLLRFETNYVNEAAEDSSSGATKPDTSGGAFRVQGSLDWHLPLGRDLDWNFLGLGKLDELDLLLEAVALYDFEEDQPANMSKVTLRFTQDSKSEASTALDLTWAAGESAPMFDQINALIVGLTVSR